MNKPPNPGVSSVGPGGTRADAEPSTVVKRGGTPGRRRKPGEDVLANPDAGRKIAPTTPAGVRKTIDVDIVEMDINRTRKPRRHTATFTSVDGKTYNFRTHDTKGKPLPYRESQALFVALRELRLGGDVFGVFEAFKLRIEDMDGQVVYPVSQEYLDMLDYHGPEASAEIVALAKEAGEEPSGFSLGE